MFDARTLTDRTKEGDALVCDEIGKSVGVRTADCVPILLLDSRRRAIAAVHAGWRGTASCIVQNVVDTMHTQYGSRQEDLFAAIGPCIQACCYEVGSDVADHFKGWASDSHLNRTKQFLNLPGINRLQLLSAGLSKLQVFESGLCTRCQADHFFSFRRESENPGRMISAICRTE